MPTMLSAAALRCTSDVMRVSLLSGGSKGSATPWLCDEGRGALAAELQPAGPESSQAHPHAFVQAHCDSRRLRLLWLMASWRLQVY